MKMNFYSREECEGLSSYFVRVSAEHGVIPSANSQLRNTVSVCNFMNYLCTHLVMEMSMNSAPDIRARACEIVVTLLGMGRDAPVVLGHVWRGVEFWAYKAFTAHTTGKAATAGEFDNMKRARAPSVPQPVPEPQPVPPKAPANLPRSAPELSVKKDYVPNDFLFATLLRKFHGEEDQ